MLAIKELTTSALSRGTIAARRHVANTVGRKRLLKPALLDGDKMKKVRLGTAAFIGLGAAQYYLGSSESFFEHSFLTNAKPEDLADFYGTEDFMQVFCGHEILANFMMRTAEFDDSGNIHAWGLLGPGELEISIDFDELEENDKLTWFNKKESFQDVAPNFLGAFTIWKMTQNFGFHLKDDGKCEVYHHGENFSGFFPIRLLFQLHSHYVIWATEKYINSAEFGMEDRDDDREVQRQNIPLHVFKQFLESLTHELERSKDKGSPQMKTEMEVTLQRLKTINRDGNDKFPLPRLYTLRSRKTNVKHAHLIIDDKETKDAIQTAMEQIGRSNGSRHGPVAEFGKLARHTTISSRQIERPKQ